MAKLRLTACLRFATLARKFHAKSLSQKLRWSTFPLIFTHAAIIKGKMEILSESAFNRNGTKLWEMFTILCAKLYKQKAITRSDFPASL